MKYFKLTNQDMTTHNRCQWAVGEWKETIGKGDLCSAGWLHCYENHLLAILFNPIHADIKDPRLWEVEVKGKQIREGQLKCGWTNMRLMKELPIPEITTVNKVAFGILCVLEICKDEKWTTWAKNWLNGKDRSKEAAVAAEWAARTAAKAAAWAAEAAEWAAEWEMWVAKAAWAAVAASVAAEAEWAAEWAAEAAKTASWVVEAEEAKAEIGKELNLIKIAKKAMKVR